MRSKEVDICGVGGPVGHLPRWRIKGDGRAWTPSGGATGRGAERGIKNSTEQLTHAGADRRRILDRYAPNSNEQNQESMLTRGNVSRNGGCRERGEAPCVARRVGARAERRRGDTNSETPIVMGNRDRRARSEKQNEWGGRTEALFAPWHRGGKGNKQRLVAETPGEPSDAEADQKRWTYRAQRAKKEECDGAGGERSDRCRRDTRTNIDEGAQRQQRWRRRRRWGGGAGRDTTWDAGHAAAGEREAHSPTDTSHGGEGCVVGAVRGKTRLITPKRIAAAAQRAAAHLPRQASLSLSFYSLAPRGVSDESRGRRKHTDDTTE